MVIDNCLWKLCKNQRVSNVSIVTLLGLWLAASVRPAAHFSSRKEVESMKAEGYIRLSGAIDQLMVSDIPGMIHFIWWFSYFWGISKSFCHECPKRSAEQTLLPGHSHSDGQRLVFSTPRHRGFNALNVVAATWQQGTGIANSSGLPNWTKDIQRSPKPIPKTFVTHFGQFCWQDLSLNSAFPLFEFVRCRRSVSGGPWCWNFTGKSSEDFDGRSGVVASVRWRHHCQTLYQLSQQHRRSWNFRTPWWDEIVGECFWKNDQVVENYTFGVTLHWQVPEFLIAAWCWPTGGLGTNNAMHAGCVHAQLRAYVK